MKTPTIVLTVIHIFNILVAHISTLKLKRFRTFDHFNRLLSQLYAFESFWYMFCFHEFPQMELVITELVLDWMNSLY